MAKFEPGYKSLMEYDKAIRDSGLAKENIGFEIQGRIKKADSVGKSIARRQLKQAEDAGCSYDSLGGIFNSVHDLAAYAS